MFKWIKKQIVRKANQDIVWNTFLEALHSLTKEEQEELFKTSKKQETMVPIMFKGGIRFDPEAKVYVAHAPELNISSQGKTKLQAGQALKDAIESVFIVSHTHLRKSERVVDELVGDIISAIIDPLEDYDVGEEQRLSMQVTDDMRSEVRQLLIKWGERD